MGAAALAVLACGPIGGLSATGSSAQATDGGTPRVGCAPDGGASPVAPGGYYTRGATVCTFDGKSHVFHGVDRPSLEWSPAGDRVSPDDFALMAGWNANVVRIALNQDFWLSGAAQYDASYAGTVAQAVSWAESAGLDVILDLHWSDRGNLTIAKSAQQPMADVNSLQFWSEVAGAYKDDGHVLFELYNEPHDVPWTVWQGGGVAGGYRVAGMQELYDAIRKTGANNLVVAGGLDWAYQLSGVLMNGVHGYNVMYATHPYDQGDKQPATWETSFGYLATQDIAPVIATEFGDGSTQCTGAWDQELIGFADQHRISWTAWAWYPGGCSFPSLISDWNLTPTAQGAVVKAALQGYPSLPRPADGGVAEDSGVAPDVPVDANPDVPVEAPPG